MSRTYRLQIIRAEDLHWQPSFRNKTPDPYVLYKLGNIDTGMTRTVKQCLSPVWDASVAFSSWDTSTTLVIEVKHGSSWGKDPCIGRVEIESKDLLEKCASKPGDVSLTLSLTRNGEMVATGRIVLRLDVVDMQTSVEISLGRAQEDVRHGKFMRYAGVSDVTESISNEASQLANQGDLYQAVGQLMAKLDAFHRIMSALSEIHPFLTVAWKLVGSLYLAVRGVMDTDWKIIDLVRHMEVAFAFVCDVERLPNKIVAVQTAVIGLLKQTSECCLFVSRYAKQRFLMRMVDINSSQKINEFEKTLLMFEQQIESGVLIHTAVVSMETPQKIDDLLLRQRLNPSHSDGFDRPICLPDTRIEIRRAISEWVVLETEQNIFWLHGVAGSGKSTVSTTIAQDFRDMSRLGAFLCFERGKSEPSQVIRTIAYKLALFDASIEKSLLEEINKDKDVGTMRSIDQFRKLLLRPLKEASSTGPILIVLDALDECGTPDTRSNLMYLLRHEFQKLPKNFRFLITSRREADIDKLLSLQSKDILAMELDYTSLASQMDVLSYLRTGMHEAVASLVEIPATFRWDESLCSLSQVAGGLFIWASTAVKLVSNSDNPFRIFKNLIADARSLTGFGLNELYATVLRSSGIAWAENESRLRFVGVLSLLLFSKVPLSNETIDGILGFPREEGSHLILSRLHCLLSYSPGSPIRVFHASFGDYLTSHENSSEPWHINTLDANRLILDRCFSVMGAMLHFNMCNLETSFVRNADVPGLEVRVETDIPSHLQYACIHWVHHLFDVPYSPDALNLLADFARQRLLFWFEVLSLKGAFSRVANSALREASEWIKNNNADLTTFLRDAADLTTMFAQPINECTPHIYTTMIPLSKDESLVSAHYLEKMSHLLQVHRIGSTRPLRYMRVLEGHSDEIYLVAVSSDGRFIASASADRSIRIWDFHSGEQTNVLMWSGGGIYSIAFLPDGTRMLSLTGDSLTIWDIRSGEPVLEHSWDRKKFSKAAVTRDGTMVALVGKNVVVVLNVSGGTELVRFEGHSNPISSVIFSYDGKLVASGSNDGTIRIWDVESGEAAFEGHCFKPYFCESLVLLSFSPDGRYIAYRSKKCLKVLDLESETVVFTTNNLPFRTGEYSPCGTRVALGSGCGTVMVLDAKTGEEVSGPFEVHSDVNAVTLSPDGRYVISGGSDWTVRIWDLSVEDVESRAYECAYEYVETLTTSDDGSRVACASDRSICVRDTNSGDVIADLISNRVGCMAFSPDNSRLVSAAVHDRTISVWNVDTGQMLFDPIECSVSVYCIAVSPDCASFASGDDEGTITVWAVATGQPIVGPFRACSSRVTSLEFSPDGTQLALGSSNGKVIILNTESWQVTSEITFVHDRSAYSDRVNSVIFSPDGAQIAVSSELTVIVWNTVQECINFESSSSLYPSHQLIFTRIGLYAVFNDRIHAVIGKLEQGGPHTEYGFNEFFDDMEWISCSKDGSRVVVVDDGIIRVHDVSDLLQGTSNHEDNDAETFSEWNLRDDGWVVNGHDGRNLLIWIPHDLRKMLRRPRVTMLNSTSYTGLDFTGAALGDQWTNCFTFS